MIFNNFFATFFLNYNLIGHSEKFSGGNEASHCIAGELVAVSAVVNPLMGARFRMTQCTVWRYR